MHRNKTIERLTGSKAGARMGFSLVRRGAGTVTFPDLPGIVYRGTGLSRRALFRYGARLRGAPAVSRTPGMPFPDMTKLTRLLLALLIAGAAGAPARRSGRAGRRRHRPSSVRPEQRPPEQRTRSPRERAPAAAGGFGHRAHRRYSGRQARLYGHRRDAHVVRPVGRAFGRRLLHRLCGEERRGGEPPHHLRVQRRAGRGIGLSDARAGRPADRGVRRQRSLRQRGCGTIRKPGSPSPISS